MYLPHRWKSHPVNLPLGHTNFVTYIHGMTNFEDPDMGNLSYTEV